MNQNDQHSLQKGDFVRITHGFRKGKIARIYATSIESWKEYCKMNNVDQESKPDWLSLMSYPVVYDYIVQIVPSFVWNQIKKSTAKRAKELLVNATRFNGFLDSSSVYCAELLEKSSNQEDGHPIFVHTAWVEKIMQHQADKELEKKEAEIYDIKL